MRIRRAAGATLSAVLSSSFSFDCREAEPLLHLYADGEAAPEDSALLEAHLAHCRPCGDRLSELRALKSALRAGAHDGVDVPEALLARVRSDIHDAARGEARRRSRLVVAPAIAAAGALVAVGVLWFDGGVFGGAPAGGGLEQRSPPLLEESLSFHDLDVPVDVASPDPARVGAFLASRVGHPVRVPRLDPAGFGLAGGRVINVDNQRASHLVYEGGLGRRLSLVAVPDPDGRLAARVRGGAETAATSNASFSGWLKGTGEHKSGHLRARRGQVAVHVWSDGASVYSLAGEIDDENLDHLVADVTSGGSRPSVSASRVAHELDPPVRR